jgi:hypothetical protein
MPPRKPACEQSDPEFGREAGLARARAISPSSPQQGDLEADVRAAGRLARCTHEKGAAAAAHRRRKRAFLQAEFHLASLDALFASLQYRAFRGEL